MVKERLVDLDFADVCSIMSEIGTAMIGTGEAMANSAHCALPKRRLPILCWLHR
jgi:cell division GTPase FtsZ